MNKVLKAISIVGNVSEVIIASSLVAEMVAKFRGSKKAISTTNPLEDNTPLPDQPIAA